MPNPAITIVIDGDTKGLGSELAKIQKELAVFGNAGATATAKAGSGMGGLIKKVIALAVAYKGLQFAVGTVGKAFTLAGQEEALQTQFETLLGSADAAQTRMDELVKFAARTPFDIPGVGKASKILETLTQGALATGDGLRFVGDIAAFSGERFDEISVHVGRLYDGLNNGRPVGESMMRMQELGLITAKSRAEIEKMQKAGIGGNAVWKIAATDMARFGGSMDKLSSTWVGLMSNLQDAWEQFLVKFAKPIINNLKPVIEDLSNFIQAMQPAANDFGERIGAVVAKIALAIKNIVTLIRSGQITEVIGVAFRVGIMGAMDLFRRGMAGTIEGLANALPVIIKEAFMILVDPNLWNAVGAQLTSIFHSLVGLLMTGMKPLLVALGPKGTGDDVDYAIKQEEGFAMNQSQLSRYFTGQIDLERTAESAFQAVTGYAKGFRNGFANSGNNLQLENAKAALAGHLFHMDKVVKSINDSIETDGKKGGLNIPEGKATFISDSKKKKQTLGFFGAGDSLTAIGGGGNVGVGGPISVAQDQLSELKAIKAEIASQTTAIKDGGLQVSTQ